MPDPPTYCVQLAGKFILIEFDLISGFTDESVNFLVSVNRFKPTITSINMIPFSDPETPIR